MTMLFLGEQFRSEVTANFSLVALSVAGSQLSWVDTRLSLSKAFR